MRKKRYDHTHPVRNFILACVALVVAASFIVGGVFLLWAGSLTIPTIEAIEAQRREQSTKIYDRTGNVLLYDMHQDVQRTAITLDEMSDHIKHATIAIEDDGFYSHIGIEPLAILRAVVRNLQDGDLLGGQGGSTLTQQVIKNTLLTQEKTVTRKFKEWILAIKLEQVVSKDEILELYLNEAPYGGTKYGVEEASQAFFGKPASELTITESAYLAALPQAPTYYSPYGNNRQALEERKNTVLLRMKEQGYITNNEYEEARATTVEFRPYSSGTIKAPHFVFYVIEQLAATYGDADLAQANLEVITTLDWELQKEAERIVYEKALENSEKFDATNASLMALDPRTGEILVMVGSRDYFDEDIDGNFNIGLAKRQPGSSFKPFAYAALLEKGYTTETILYDAQTQFSTNCAKTDMRTGDGCYAPGNYDNVYRGPMTIREALAQSVNVPAVKAVYLAGVDKTIDVARRMGVTSLDPNRDYGLTLVLGGGEVSLLEMTSAYGAFAQEGYRFKHTAVREVRTTDGGTLEKLDPFGEEVLEREVARSITDMLKDNNARTPAFGANSFLYFPSREVAAKTGTTNDYRDAWIIGYTPSIAVGAWAGNNDNSPMQKKVAGFIVAPMWNEFLQVYFERYPATESFTTPQPIGTELHPVLRGISNSTVSSSTANTPHSILHYINKHNPRQGGTSRSDGQYPYWEYGVLMWHIKNASSSHDGGDSVDIPKPAVTITEPDQDERIREDEEVWVRVSIRDDIPIKRLYYYFDREFVAMRDEGEDFMFTPREYGLTEGEHQLYVIVENELGGRNGDSVEFEVR